MWQETHRPKLEEDLAYKAEQRVPPLDLEEQFQIREQELQILL
jgi:hypothetical protein